MKDDQDLFSRKLNSKKLNNFNDENDDGDSVGLIDDGKRYKSKTNYQRNIFYLLCLTACVILTVHYFHKYIAQSTDLLFLNNQVASSEIKYEEKVIKPLESSTEKEKLGCLSTFNPLEQQTHIVPPPDGPVTTVCCETTAGFLNIAVHKNWAPEGAKRFLLMVNSNFFSTKVSFFRSLKNFLVQFGLAGDPKIQTYFHTLGNLKDDPQWLPLGPTGREINGIKRFQKGYLGYAGAGNNSRGTQLIMAFEDNLYLGGGCPWEVPFAQLFGNESYQTLSKIYTGYGEGPSQTKIMNRGNLYLESLFPKLDYINSCKVMKENIPWKYLRPT
jgi:cyclophilin family peptidyl-prolyl cis-trans isomerase